MIKMLFVSIFLKKKKYQKVLFKLLLSFDTVMYMVGGNMMLCCTTTWTLSKTL